jgi:hypothetical protein
MTDYGERWAVNTCYESKNLILIIRLSKTPYKFFPYPDIAAISHPDVNIGEVNRRIRFAIRWHHDYSRG